jgi:hypothetical protein
MLKTPFHHLWTPKSCKRTSKHLQEDTTGILAAPEVAPTARTAPAASETGADTEMLSARVSTAIARQFRSLAKLKGQKVQGMMETALSEYLERNRF